MSMNVVVARGRASKGLVRLAVSVAAFHLGVAATVVAKEVPVSGIEASARAIAKKHPDAASQKKLLESSLAAAAESVPTITKDPEGDADRHLATLRTLAVELGSARAIVRNAYGEPPFVANKTGSSGDGDHRFDPVHLRYEFGTHGLRLIKDGFPVKGKSGLVDAAKPEKIAVTTRLAWLREGTIPDAELAIAAIERRLDIDPRAEALSQYVEFWRNGAESFYEALDRTAGSPDGIFYYDRMLDDYAQRFLTPEEKKSKAFLFGGRDYSHDKFHQSFLTLRQYRSFLEAIAHTLVLPPDVKLPARLALYEFREGGSTALSLRDQIDILLANANGDVPAVLDFVTEFLKGHPLPEVLWDHDAYKPLEAFGELVIARVAVSDAATRGWVKEWGGDPASLNRHYDLSIAYRSLRQSKATRIREAALADATKGKNGG